MIMHTARNGGLKITSTNGFVDVESVRFTGADIGIDGTTDIMQLTVASSVATVAFKHKLTTGGLATLESATVTNALTASAAVTVGTTLGVTGATTLTGTTLMKESVTLDKAAATITHTDASGAGSLTISSTTGNVAISAKTGSTVDVESIRFKDAQIGRANDVTLTSGGTSTVAFEEGHHGASSPSREPTDTSKELYVNGDVYAVTSASDARFKRDVRPISRAMDVARAVSVTFGFKVDNSRTGDFRPRGRLGHPQELETTLPDLVDGRPGVQGRRVRRLGGTRWAVKEPAPPTRSLRQRRRSRRRRLRWRRWRRGWRNGRGDQEPVSGGRRGCQVRAAVGGERSGVAVPKA